MGHRCQRRSGLILLWLLHVDIHVDEDDAQAVDVADEYLFEVFM